MSPSQRRKPTGGEVAPVAMPERGKTGGGQLDVWLGKELHGFLARDIDRVLFAHVSYCRR